MRGRLPRVTRRRRAVRGCPPGAADQTNSDVIAPRLPTFDNGGEYGSYYPELTNRWREIFLDALRASGPELEYNSCLWRAMGATSGVFEGSHTFPRLDMLQRTARHLLSGVLIAAASIGLGADAGAQVPPVTFGVQGMPWSVRVEEPGAFPRITVLSEGPMNLSLGSAVWSCGVSAVLPVGGEVRAASLGMYDRELTCSHGSVGVRSTARCFRSRDGLSFSGRPASLVLTDSGSQDVEVILECGHRILPGRRPPRPTFDRRLAD